MKCEKWTDQHDTSVGQRKIRVSCRNQIHDQLRGLGKSMVVFRVFEKLRYWNERSTKFESLKQK